MVLAGCSHNSTTSKDNAQNTPQDNPQNTPQDNPQDNPDNSQDNNQQDDTSPTIQETQQTKTFVLTGENFKFMMNGVDNPTLRVNKGDKVVINFQSTDGFHDWTLDEFKAATSKVNSPGSASVEFIADKTGTFEYYCSIGQHRANGMKGAFIVE